jgi:small neutral amino acid transporter SnatA (MarC family)
MASEMSKNGVKVSDEEVTSHQRDQSTGGAEGGDCEDQTAPLARQSSILALTLVALLAAGPIMRRLGARIEAVITRLLGVLLAALAAQFVIDGVRASFL